MNENIEISLVSDETERDALKQIAEYCVQKDKRYLLYCIGCMVLSLFFLAFTVYAVYVMIKFGTEFQLGMLIYILVPLLGAVLPFSFAKMKKKELIREVCEDQYTRVSFESDRIIVNGEHSARLVQKNDGAFVYEKQQSLLRNTSGELKSVKYEFPISRVRYYAYDEEFGKFRFVMGVNQYPDLSVPPGNGLKELMEQLEQRGIRKTGYIK